MRIGELARQASVSRDTIRFYERNGLLSSSPGASRTNNYRDYPDSAVLTLELIQEAKAAGFTLAELVIFLGQIEASNEENFDGDAFLQEKIEEVEAKIIRSQKFLQTLKLTRQALADSP